MNIFDQAMEIETKGEALYRQFALEAPNKGMRNIFTWLADREREHYGIFREMKTGKSVELTKNTILRDVRDIFEEWLGKTPCIEPTTAQVVLYRKALEVEKKSVSVYEAYAATAAPSLKKIFLRIAAEEKGHRRIMENIIELVTKPDVWAENAEFSHLDENYYL